MKEMRNEDNFIDRGGCTVLGDSITPTLIRGYYKMIGNTQDDLTIIILDGYDDD